MSPSIWHWSLMSVGGYFKYILVYSSLDIGVPKKKSFRSQDINLAPWRASKIVLLNSIFDSKMDSTDDDASSVYSSLYPPNVNLTLYGSDFSGR